MQRRTFVRWSAAAVAVGALGGGLAWSRARRARALRSDPITGEWTALGPGVQWLLPDLRRARMVVPDRPHSRGEVLDPARRARILRCREFFVDTGPRRLRGAAFADMPAAGTRRLLAIGDSVTFGWGVAGEEAWPARLEVRLRAAGRAVEVLNAGVPAQTLLGMEGYMVREAPGLGLGGVLFVRRPPAADTAATDHYLATVAHCREALPEVPFLVLLPPLSRFDPAGCARGPDEERRLAAGLGEIPLLDLTAALRAAQGERGAALRVADGHQVVVDLPTGAPLLRAPAPAEGLAPEVYALFERDPGVREALFFDDGHPDAAGHDVVATAVAESLDRAGWWG